jgi:hypothetical protein
VWLNGKEKANMEQPTGCMVANLHELKSKEKTKEIKNTNEIF